jgi:uncharacterized membrane-anchored protein
MNFKQWVIDLFKDERGSTSIKPVLAFIGSMFLYITMILSHKFHPADNLVNAIMIITLTALGADSADKFSFKKKPEEPQSSEELKIEQ